MLGDMHWSFLASALYLAVMGVGGLRIAGHRLARLRQP
jgi:hypothetical protein